MGEEQLKILLQAIAEGGLSPEEGLEQLRHLPFEDLGFAQVDHHRSLRQGQPEVIFGQGKTVEQVGRIMKVMVGRGSNVLVTRLEQVRAVELLAVFPQASYHDEARCLTLEATPRQERGRGTILVVSAGTSDLAVASEAVVTARFLGNKTELDRKSTRLNSSH